MKLLYHGRGSGAYLPPCFVKQLSEVLVDFGIFIDRLMGQYKTSWNP